MVMVDRVLDLAKGEADIAFRTSDPKDDALVARKVAEVPWAVFASSSYIARRGAPKPSRRLTATTWFNSMSQSPSIPAHAG